MTPPPNKVAIKRLTVLLEHLSSQTKQIDQLNSQHKSHWLIENNNLFSQHLFSTESDLFTPYVTEVKKRLDEFARLYHSSFNNNNKAEFAKSSLTHIEQQISALMNAIQSNQTMHKAAQVSFDARKKVRTKWAKVNEVKKKDKYNKMVKSVILTSQQLYQQLAEHHEFERRLLEMITERENKRQRSQSINAGKLSQEILALHQRLGRCRKAISSIERNIELAEKKGLR
ncbi:MAG: primosomal replication protein N'' [Colwellia sp.]|nr:primosomal replication protein N'' [Colwellia sp.]